MSDKRIAIGILCALCAIAAMMFFHIDYSVISWQAADAPAPRLSSADIEKLRDRCAGNSYRGTAGFLNCVKAFGATRSYYDGSKLIEY